MKLRLMLAACLLQFSVPPNDAFAQPIPDVTGVPDAALQFTKFDLEKTWGEHESLCGKTLKTAIPGAKGTKENLVIEQNFAGIYTSRWDRGPLVFSAISDGWQTQHWRGGGVGRSLISLGFLSTLKTWIRGVKP